jgi:hypothetical protein
MKRNNKKYIVVPRTEKTMLDGIATSKGKLEFGTKTGVYVDSSVASEIDTHHGEHGSNDVWVCEDERLTWHERNDSMTDGKNAGIHHYTFAGVDMARRGGNDRVKVKIKGGYTYVSREVAEEEGYTIVKVRKHGRNIRTAAN